MLWKLQSPTEEGIADNLGTGNSRRFMRMMHALCYKERRNVFSFVKFAFGE